MSESPTTWPEIRAWRKQQREALLRARVDAGTVKRQEWGREIEGELRRILSPRSPKIVGFYWPFKGEFDARPLARELIAGGIGMALPAVVQPKTPLEFRRWTPGMEMESAVYNIPVPKARDDAGYRLGYGGGYYDRTIAAFKVRPHAIGIGFELSRLATIYPQDFDLRMSVIVTETGVKT
jgi:5-formyltetrahydrofolate cyclo-ligase